MRDTISHLLSPAYPSLTAILIWRFLLALQRANQAGRGNGAHPSYGDGATGGAGTGHDTLRFASVVIGSIGESLMSHSDYDSSELDPNGTLDDEDDRQASESRNKDGRQSEQDVVLAETSMELTSSRGTRDVVCVGLGSRC